MKLCYFGLAILLAASASAAPALPVDQAVALAHQHLKGRDGSGKYYLTSIKLEPDNARRSSFHWSVSWSEAIPLDELKKEVGLEIAMDGTIVSVVRGAANKDPSTGKYDPNGATGLQNWRTRTDRPSILDLKR